MTNTRRASLLSLALLTGCFAGDPGSVDTGTSTVTLTAADLDGGARPVLDLPLDAERWVLDASEGPLDLWAIAVRTPERTMTLADWLMEAGGMGEGDVEELGGIGLELRSVTAPAPVNGPGQHEELDRTHCVWEETCDSFDTCVEQRRDCKVTDSTAVAGAISTTPG